MPRRRQTQSGAPAQNKPPVAGQTYGQGADQQRLEQAMPTPATPPVPRAAAPVAAPAPAAPDYAAILAAARSAGGQPGALTLPTARPNEPITAGLSRGPGPGPSAMGLVRGSPAGDILRRLSDSTGDSYFADLAAKAGA